MNSKHNYQMVDCDTGEIIADFSHQDDLSEGFSIKSSEQKERNYLEMKKREEHERQYRRGNSEKYIFVDMYCRFEDLRPATVTKLIYLSTFSNYDNFLVLDGRAGVPIKHGDLASVLGISRTKAHYFWKEVSPKYLSEEITEDGTAILRLNVDIFRRGKLKRKEFSAYQQMYHDGIRSVYEAADGKGHNYLGYVFGLLPFISREWNIICDNPLETDIDKVKKVSIQEFCKLVGYKDSSNISKLKRIYDSLRFTTDKGKQRFCTCDSGGKTIAVNPNVLYVGSNSNKVEVLKLFFKD